MNIDSILNIFEYINKYSFHFSISFKNIQFSFLEKLNIHMDIHSNSGYSTRIFMNIFSNIHFHFSLSWDILFNLSYSMRYSWDWFWKSWIFTWIFVFACKYLNLKKNIIAYFGYLVFGYSRRPWPRRCRAPALIASLCYSSATFPGS